MGIITCGIIYFICICRLCEQIRSVPTSTHKFSIAKDNLHATLVVMDLFEKRYHYVGDCDSFMRESSCYYNYVAALNNLYTLYIAVHQFLAKISNIFCSVPPRWIWMYLAITIRLLESATFNFLLFCQIIHLPANSCMVVLKTIHIKSYSWHPSAKATLICSNIYYRAKAINFKYTRL